MIKSCQGCKYGRKELEKIYCRKEKGYKSENDLCKFYKIKKLKKIKSSQVATKSIK